MAWYNKRDKWAKYTHKGYLIYRVCYNFNLPLGNLKLLSKTLVATDRISSTIQIIAKYEEIDKDNFLETIKPS